MALRKYNPITPGLRQLVLVDRSQLWKGKPVKALTEGRSESAGRNVHGHITSRRRGGGHKRTYRIVDFKRRKFDMPATVERLEYDPNRTAFIALIKYEDGEQSYILAPQRLNAGDRVVSGIKVDVKPGNAMPMANMPVGTIIHNVEMKLGKGGQIARSAGCYAQLVGRDQGMAILRLNSGEMRMVQADCMATVGAVSNPDNSNQKSWQSWPQSLARQASQRPRCRHEPGRPSAWRRRRPHFGRAPSCYAVGQGHQGHPHPQEPEDG